MEIGPIRAHLARPIVAERIRLRAADTRTSRTAAEIRRVELRLASPWRFFFGDRRFFREATVTDLRGVFDFGSRVREATGRAPAASPAGARPSIAAQTPLLPLLPEALRLEQASIEVLSGSQSYFLENVTANFDEQHLGTFTATGGEIHTGPVVENFGALRGVTAWKDGSVYLADLALRDGLRVENFHLDLVRTEGLSLSLEAVVAGGRVHGGVSFGRDTSGPVMDAAWWVSHLDLSAIARLLGAGAAVDGTIREARVTFRGNPARPFDGQASLRLAAGGVRWKERGWESLTLGASLSGRRLAVSEFTLRQKENAVSADGEIALTENFAELSKAPFLLNLTASIQNLGALAGLLGKPFDEMSGRMSLSSSVNGRLGAINGFVSVEGSAMGFRNRPIEAGRVEITIVNSEAQVTQCELWSGRDYVRGKGSVHLRAPHQYSGEVQARVEDVSAYLGLLRSENILPVSAGIAQVRWQGDGTASAHSGAFQVALDRLVSAWTPSGLTGRFAGTYSPQNIYFSGFELEQGPLRFSTRATLAGSGVKLQDAVLRARGREIADAEIFLPLDPFAWTAGKSLAEAVLDGRPLYADVATRGALGVRDLLRLAGNDLPAAGTVRLNLRASGLPAAPVLDGRLEGRGLALESAGGDLPPTLVDATVKAAEGRGTLTGEIKSAGTPTTTLSATFPAALRSGPGGLTWHRADDVFSGRLDVPRWDLAALRPLFPRVHRLAGKFSAQLTWNGPWNEPGLTGRVTLADGLLQTWPKATVIDALTATLVAENGTLRIETLQGTAGGPFSLTGGLTFAAGGPSADLTFTGSRLLLAEDKNLKIPAEVSLQAKGTPQGGAVTGAVALVDAVLAKKLEVTPVLTPVGFQEESLLASRFLHRIPPPLDGWTLDVAVKNENRFTLGSGLTGGSLVADLRLTGTLGRPVPVGTITVANARIFLPFTTLAVTQGTVAFVESAPWMPQVDFRGTARAREYEVQAYAFGPLRDRRLILRSEPALGQTELVSLLTAGLLPGFHLGPVGRPFSAQLQSDPAPNEIAANPEAPRGRLLLWQTLSLAGEPVGTTAPRVGYKYRFQ
jgi:hypothetical protein